MKNPYAKKPPPDTDLRVKARKLAAWHEQEAAAADLACSLATAPEDKARALQQAAWHRDTARAWLDMLDQETGPGAPGAFSARG